jgi:hypothetical protein
LCAEIRAAESRCQGRTEVGGEGGRGVGGGGHADVVAVRQRNRSVGGDAAATEGRCRTDIDADPTDHGAEQIQLVVDGVARTPRLLSGIAIAIDDPDEGVVVGNEAVVAVVVAVAGQDFPQRVVGRRRGEGKDAGVVTGAVGIAAVVVIADTVGAVVAVAGRRVDLQRVVGEVARGSGGRVGGGFGVARGAALGAAGDGGDAAGLVGLRRVAIGTCIAVGRLRVGRIRGGVAGILGLGCGAERPVALRCPVGYGIPAVVIAVANHRYAPILSLELDRHSDAQKDGECHRNLCAEIRAAESRCQGRTDVRAEGRRGVGARCQAAVVAVACRNRNVGGDAAATDGRCRTEIGGYATDHGAEPISLVVDVVARTPRLLGGIAVAVDGPEKGVVVASGAVVAVVVTIVGQDFPPVGVCGRRGHRRQRAEANGSSTGDGADGKRAVHLRNPSIA